MAEAAKKDDRHRDAAAAYDRISALFGSDHPAEQARNLYKAGRALTEASDLEASAKRHEAAYALFRTEGADKTKMAFGDLLTARDNAMAFGEFLLTPANSQFAERVFSEAVALNRALVPAHRHRDGINRELVLSLYKLARSVMLTGKPEDALARFDEGLTIARAHLAKVPHDSDAKHLVAVGLRDRAEALSTTGETAGAIEAADEARALLSEAVIIAPGLFEPKLDLVRTLLVLAAAQEASGDQGQSKANLESALEIIGTLRGMEADTLLSQAELRFFEIRTRSYLAFLSARAGETRSAREGWRRALEAVQRIFPDGRQTIIVRAELLDIFWGLASIGELGPGEGLNAENQEYARKFLALVKELRQSNQLPPFRKAEIAERERLAEDILKLQLAPQPDSQLG